MKQEEWQKGNDSSLSSMERLKLHNEWLKQIHQEIKDNLIKPISNEDEVIVGFID